MSYYFRKLSNKKKADEVEMKDKKVIYDKTECATDKQEGEGGEGKGTDKNLSHRKCKTGRAND